jgi:putative transposase
VKGLSLNMKGLSLNVKGLSLNVKGLSLNVKGLSLNVKGLTPSGWGEGWAVAATSGMARKPRVEKPDGVHHVFARGNGGQLIYLDDADRNSYLAMLARVVVWKRWRCLAYCLMDNHLHLLLETPLPNLGAGMQWLHGRFAQQFNARHRRSGHVFQSRFGSVLVDDEAQLWTVATYIARNPVAAGLCARPVDWAWSSHRAIVGRAAIPWLDSERLLSYYDALGGEPRQRYREAVEREGSSTKAGWASLDLAAMQLRAHVEPTRAAASKQSKQTKTATTPASARL